MYEMYEPKSTSAVTTGQSCSHHWSRVHAAAQPPKSKVYICTWTSNSEMAPLGMGRLGSLMASISRSYQSLIVCV